MKLAPTKALICDCIIMITSSITMPTKRNSCIRRSTTYHSRFRAVDGSTYLDCFNENDQEFKGKRLLGGFSQDYQDIDEIADEPDRE